MKNFLSYIRNWSTPLMFLALLILSFGLLIPLLGFYWDDWETILLINQFDLSEFWDYFGGSRPFAAWTYVLFSPILGTTPVNWHLFTLFLRWLTVLSMWWAFGNLWPHHKPYITYTALLFAVYPVFNQQPIAVAYHQHWTGYALYFFSIGMMVQAVKHKSKRLIFTTLSLLTLILHFAIFEYFIGMELLRPLILWVAISQTEAPLTKKLIRTLKNWLPYMVMLMAFVIWRINLSATIDTDRPTLLFNLLAQPIPTSIHLLQMILQDTIYVLISNWYTTLEPLLVDFGNKFNLLSWGIAFLCAAGTFFFLKKRPEPQNNSPQSKQRWIKQAFLIGFAATILGTLPIWTTDRQVISGLYNDRFALPAMFGASLLFVATIVWLVQKKAQQTLILCVLIGLAAGSHLRIQNTYRWSWTTQQRIYWQLYWRAPQIQPQTNFLSDGEIFPYVRPTYAFNLLYQQPKTPKQPAYGFFMLARDLPHDMHLMPEGMDITADFRGFHEPFQSNSLDSLVIYYHQPETGCLWVLTPEDQNLPSFIPSITREAAYLSNLNRIQPTIENQSMPPENIFGKEPEHNWCYYFEKAELNRQTGNWTEIIQLTEQAQEKGYTPSSIDSPREWMPFIEAYAHENMWQTASQISLESLARDIRYRPTLCSLWQSLEANTPASQEKTSTLHEIYTQMECSH